jgi:hypothetical protein
MGVPPDDGLGRGLFFSGVDSTSFPKDRGEGVLITSLDTARGIVGQRERETRTGRGGGHLNI